MKSKEEIKKQIEKSLESFVKDENMVTLRNNLLISLEDIFNSKTDWDETYISMYKLAEESLTSENIYTHKQQINSMLEPFEYLLRQL